MRALSIVLPNTLAQASQVAAKKLGVSRTQFIRQAIAHELANFQAKLEQDAIIASIQAMKHSKHYLEENAEITEQLNTHLPKDKEAWWSQK